MSRALTWARLAWRLNRSEIVFVAALCLALAGAAAWLALDMRSAFARCGTSAATDACGVIYAFQNTHGNAVQTIHMAISLVPFLVGLVLGVPVVAREVEHRTALIAWPMSASRVRWLAWRLGPLLVIGILLVGVLGLASDQMWRAYVPNSEIGFAQYEARGLPFVMRGALMLVSGVALGTIIGRLLPALLAGIGLSVAISVVLGMALSHWVPSAELAGGEMVVFGPGPLRTGTEYRLPDGTVVSAQEGELFAERVYAAAGGDEPDEASLPQMISYGVPAQRYPEVLIRETAAIGAATVGVGAVAAFALRRRRPE